MQSSIQDQDSSSSTEISTKSRVKKSWGHVLTDSPPLHRCQVLKMPSTGEGMPINRNYLSKVHTLLLEDKLLVSPIIFEGVMVSRTNVYKGLYFVSFKVIQTLKGRLNAQLHGHVRLLFQTERTGSRTQLRNNACPPVPFGVRSGRKYLVFVKKVGVARYAAVAEPELVRNKTKKCVLKTFCKGCVGSPDVLPLPNRSVREGRNLKLKCKLRGGKASHPPPAFSWYKDGNLLKPSRDLTIKSKKKRSKLLLYSLSSSDAGQYSCQASNLVGSSESTSSVLVRTSVSIRGAAECPIQHFCLHGGSCLYYEMIRELVCRCTEGYAGQRCQFKKATLHPALAESGACGPYGHDIQLAEICAAWNSPNLQEMTKEEYKDWMVVEEKVKSLKTTNTTIHSLQTRS